MFRKEDLPPILIEKITLETVRSDSRKKLMPHVEDDTEEDITKNRFGIKKRRQTRPTSFLNINKQHQQRRSEKFSNITSDGFSNINAQFNSLSESSSSRMRVTLDILLQDVIQDDSVLMTLLDDEMIRKYLKISVVQITDSNVLAEFINKFDELSAKDFNILKAMGKIDSKTISLEENQIASNTQIAGSVPSQSIKVEGTAVEDVFSSIPVHGISFKVVFDSKDPFPKELFYVVYTHIDIEALAQDFDFEVGESFKNISSNLIIETAIQSGEITSQGYLFVEKGGDIWNGLVTLDDDGRYFKYNTNEELMVRTVPHNVIQDFREVEQIKRLNIDYDFIERELTKTIFSGRVNKEVETSNKNNFFSELCLTVDEDNNTRGSFSFDIREFLESKSSYGSLLTGENKKRLEEIYNRTRIKELLIYRTRIRNYKDINKLGVLNFTTAPFENSKEEYELVISSGETNPGNFISANTNSGFIRAIRSYHEGQKDVRKHIKTYTFLDKTFEKITYGLYKYKVVVNVEDGALKFLEDSLKILEDSRIILERYQAEASNPEYYNISTDRFTQKFIEEQRRKYIKTHKTEEAPWIRTVVDFISMIELFGARTTSRLDLLYKLIAPETGNLSGIRTLDTLYGRVIDQLKMLVGGTSSNRTATFPKKSSLRRKSEYTGVLQGERMFYDVVDADISVNSGLDFLEFSTIKNENKTGLKTLSGEAYRERVEEETQKYFHDAQGVVDIVSDRRVYAQGLSLDTTKLTYLTPARIINKFNGNINLTKNNSEQWDKNYMNKAFMFLNDKNQKIDARNISQVYDKKSRENNIIFLKEEGANNTDKKGFKYQNSRNILGTSFKNEDSSKVIANKEDKEETVDNNGIIISVLRDRKKGKLYGNRTIHSNKQQQAIKYDVNSTRNILDVKEFSINEIEQLPNHIKSILGGSSGHANVKGNIFIKPSEQIVKEVDTENKSAFDFNYNLLKVVEVLTGYQRNSDHRINIRRPIWKKLTIDIYNDAVGYEMICRLRNYNGKGIENNYLNDMSIKTYNDYFIITPLRMISEPTTGEEVNILEQIERELTDKIKEAAGIEIPKGVSNFESSLISREMTATTERAFSKKVQEDDAEVSGIPSKYVNTTIFRRKL